MTGVVYGAAIAAMLGAMPLALGQVDVSPPPVDQGQSCSTIHTTALGLAPKCAGLAARNGLVDSALQPADDQNFGPRVLFATGSLGGYDSAFNGREGVPGATGVGGWIDAEAVFGGGDSYAILQNTAVGIDYQIGGGTIQYLDTALLATAGSLSPRTTWTVDVDNSFGNDSLRLIGLPVSQDNTEIGSYGIHSGKVLDNDITGRIFLQNSDTRLWTFSVRNSFRDFFDDGSHIDTIHGRAEYSVQTSERTKVGVFEETAHQSGVAGCTTQSEGITYQRRLSSAAAVEGAGGPTVGSSGCGRKLTLNLYGAFSMQPWRPTSIYVWGYRKLNDSNFGSATYENTVQSGLVQKLALHTWVKAQGGWVQGASPSNNVPFQGTYIAVLLEHALRGGFLFSISAQHFNWSGVPNIAPARTLFAGSLSWSPGNRVPGNMPATAIR